MTFTQLTGHLQGLHTVPPTFVRVMLELSDIRVCFVIKLTRFNGLASWSGLHLRLYIRTRTVSYGLTQSCTIANTIIHGHGTRVSFLKVLKIIHGFHGCTRMARMYL